MKDAFWQKMKFLCQNTPSGKEWSGLFFYDTNTKNIFEDDFIVTPTEFVLLDVGSEVFTDFTTNEYFIKKMVELNKFESNYGLLHSHHGMGVTPSSTDNSTTHSMAEEMPVFLTVIINNKYDINAKIATIVTVNAEETINIRCLNGEKKVVNITPEEKKILYYRQLDLTFDEISIDDNELKERIQFLIEEKAKQESLNKAVYSYVPRESQLNIWDKEAIVDTNDYMDDDLKVFLGYDVKLSVSAVLNMFSAKHSQTKDYLKLTNELTANLNKILKDTPELHYIDAIDELIDTLDFHRLNHATTGKVAKSINFVTKFLKTKKQKLINE